jgi:multiple sugar transport system permease protein
MGLSLFRWKLIDTPRFVGLGNYTNMFLTDALFKRSLGITARYIVIAVPLAQVVALGIAVLLNQRIRLLGMWRTIFYVPAIVSGVAGSVIWMWMYNVELGAVNNILLQLGINGPRWLFDTRYAMTALIVRNLWNLGAPMVVYLAGLQGMPQSLYEAAEIDGAGVWTRFWRVTLPMLSPVVFFNVVMGFIGGVQIFSEPYVMTKGGPQNSTLFLGLHLYNTAFHYLEMGYASGMAWVMFVIILSLTLIQFRIAKSWVYYESE